MEDKQLDFNAPLLSVRRLSSTSVSSDGTTKKIIEKSQLSKRHSLPLCKSDWELGDVTKPAAVPFLWEQIPGRAKDGSETLPQRSKGPSSSPRLPPGRVLDIVKHVPDRGFEDRQVSRQQFGKNHLNKNATVGEILIKGVSMNKDTGLDSEDDAFSDALTSLSPAESLSWSCSVSGLSGNDGPDVKRTGTFSTDPQTRDFMMSRFLPAAKAMVIATPQHVSKKQPAIKEQPRQVRKVVSGELRPLLEKYGSNTIPPHSRHKQNVESEEEDDENDNPGKKSFKSCGLFPRLCVKNSLRLLNPVPGAKSRAQSPVPSAGGVRRVTRTSYSGPLPRTQQTWDSTYRKKIQPETQSRELREVEKKLTSEFNQFFHSTDSFMTDGTSPPRPSRGGRISPYRNEAPRSPFHDGASFLGIPKEFEQVETKKFSSVRKGCDKPPVVLSCRTYKQESNSVNPVVEKTLYIDSAVDRETPILNSVFSEAKGLTNSFDKKVVGSRGTEEVSTVSRDVIRENLLEGGKMVNVKASEALDADLPSFSRNLDARGQEHIIEGVKVDQDLDQKPVSLECSKFHPNSNLHIDNGAYDPADPGVGPMRSPLPPPLPKSPSESWLWRTLPSVSLRNPFSHSHPGNQLHSKKHGQKTSTNDTKWETIVKTSNLRHDHVRYSEVMSLKFCS
ncbi:hypothetical protein RJ640_017352 [Escallonia rubra]|uniref:Uncharacterized protein n=1 Tax=Escallonia rubra TaxID=112253 RepID=A0AA88RTM1_9ASTE|nr:hypothetical protein RJ640_017352 [Escallonia rubra]